VFLLCRKDVSYSLLGEQSQSEGNGQSSGSRKRDERRERTAKAWFPARMHDDPEEEENVPLKRTKISSADKGNQV